MLFLSIKVWSQEPLKIGDSMPYININSISFPRDKLVILDFMATNCPSCLKLLPRLDSLQRYFGDKIRIFLVTSEKNEKARRFRQSHSTLELPIIGEDSILSKLFPHTFISHEVWINNGVVRAITFPEYVNSQNIETILSDQPVHWKVKNDLLAKKYEKITDSIKHVIVIRMENMPAKDMYLRCYGRTSYPAGHIRLQMKAPEMVFTFEATLPSTLSPAIFQKTLLSKLDSHLGLHGKIDSIKVKGYLLKAGPGIHLLSKDSSRALARTNGTKSISVAELVFMLNDTWEGIPVVNESGYSKQYLNLPESCVGNLSMLQEELAKWGLNLLKSDVKAEMLLIREFSNYKLHHENYLFNFFPPAP